jgi:hypothetical protein
VIPDKEASCHLLRSEKSYKEVVRHERGIQGDLAVLENSMGSLHEVDDGHAGSRGDDAGDDPEKRCPAGRIAKDGQGVGR